jgi:uncharacterized membrane protein YfhO
MTEPAGVTIYEREDWKPRAFVVHEALTASDEGESLELISQPDLDLTRTAVIQVRTGANCHIEAGNAEDDRVEVLSYEPDRVVLEAEASTAGWLILSDLYYPGWRAFLNGDQVPIQPTNHGLRGICLPAGVHEVVFEFQPELLFYGALLTGLALAVLFASAIIWGRKQI